MFRRGGTVNDGIMTGLTDRTQKSNGDIVGRARELTPGFSELLSEFTPQTKLPLGQLGLNLISGKFAGDGLLKNLAGSAQGPYAQFTKADDAREAAIRGGAAKLGISQAMSEAKPDKTSVLAAEKKAKILLKITFAFFAFFAILSASCKASLAFITSLFASSNSLLALFAN